MTGSTADISELCEFEWYQWVYFRDQTASFPEEEEVLGRYLCPASDIGPTMCMNILKDTGCVASRTTLRPLTQIEIDSPDEKIKRVAFNKAIREGPLGSRMEGSEDDDLELLTPMCELPTRTSVQGTQLHHSLKLKMKMTSIPKILIIICKLKLFLLSEANISVAKLLPGSAMLTAAPLEKPT
jgi:hypothetical protein